MQSRFITVLWQNGCSHGTPIFFWNVVTRQRCSSNCAGGAAWSSSGSPATAPSVPHTCAAANSSSSSGDKPAPPHWAHEDVSPVAGLYFESGAGTGTPESSDRLERGKGEETTRRCAGLETQWPARAWADGAGRGLDTSLKVTGGIFCPGRAFPSRVIYFGYKSPYSASVVQSPTWSRTRISRRAPTRRKARRG